MRLFRYDKRDAAAFKKALIDYLSRTGRYIPVSLQTGRQPEIKTGRHGKPYFAEPDLEDVFFSRSHTGDFEIVCFSDSEVGLDCEDVNARKNRNTDFEKIAERCFLSDERAYMDAGNPGSEERFFEIWTGKEAYMKYTGRGFSEGFLSFSVFDLPDAEIYTGRIESAPFVIYSVCSARSDGAHGFDSALTEIIEICPDGPVQEVFADEVDSAQLYVTDSDPERLSQAGCGAGN